MTTRVLLIAGGLLVASLSPALADSVTAGVTAWDATSRTITLEDKSQIINIPAAVTVPQDLKAGDNVTVDFEGDENGIAKINSVTINSDVARRVVPLPQKRG